MQAQERESDQSNNQMKYVQRFDHSASVTFRDKSTLQNIDSDSFLLETEDCITNIKRLPYFQSLLLATILEDTITKQRILDFCNNELKVNKVTSDMPLLLALKFEVEQPAEKDELDGVNAKRLHCTEYKLAKLEHDRRYLLTVLYDTYSDIVLNQDYQVLLDHVTTIVERDQGTEVLINEEAKNRLIRKDLAKQLRQKRNHFKSVIYDADVMIDALITEVEDSALNADIRRRYVENWQRGRTEQHLYTIDKKERGHGDVIDYYKTRNDHEQRVHTEVDLLINIAINETLEKVEEWMEKYDNDMEDIDLKIQIKKNDYQNMLDKRVGLEDTIEKHDQLMKDWIYFKEEREKLRLYREKMTQSAITVQAWWRGILVRLQLGPYRVAKRKKGGKKK